MKDNWNLNSRSKDIEEVSERIRRYLRDHEGVLTDDGGMLQMFKAQAMAEKYLGLSNEAISDEDFRYRSTLPKVPVDSLAWLDYQEE